MTEGAFPRLSNASLDRLGPAMARAGYDRTAVRCGIVHLGIGAFHRAHQAVYTDAVLASGDMRWGITGASLRSPATRDALSPQDGLYSVAVRDGDGERLQLVGSLGRVLAAPENPGALLDAMGDPSVAIVSLTVTEKGYHRDPATGDLDALHPDIAHDLANPQAPRTALGFIVEAIARRRAAGVDPFAILSCDNIPSNGRTTHRLVEQFAGLRDRDLARFIADSIACPSTMVDRIVPATTPDDRIAVANRLRLADAWPVITEPFSQWVIEDAFRGRRPEWDSAGAGFVADVEPYELMKLRLLNGAHSTIAYLGWLAGHETVADAMAAPGFASLVRGMMDDEITPGLPALPDMDLPAYKNALIARFRNPALRHRTGQIAMDGSQKIPQRLLGPIRDCLKRGNSIDRLALGVAGWMRYVTGLDERDQPFEIQDPMASELRQRTRNISSTGALADALMGIRSIFGTDLPRDPVFRRAVDDQLSSLLTQGAARTVAALEGISARIGMKP